jgi:hypothetical protein
MFHLMALGQKHLVPILLYLFHRVEQRLQEGTPSLLVVEEAWVTALAIGSRSRFAAREALVRCFKELSNVCFGRGRFRAALRSSK